jgi:hypothetical protein
LGHHGVGTSWQMPWMDYDGADPCSQQWSEM